MEDARDHEDEWLPVDNAVLDVLDGQKADGTEQRQAGAQYQRAIVNEFAIQISLGHKGAERVAEDQSAGQKAEANCAEKCRIRLDALYITNLRPAVTHPHSWGRI